MSSGLQAGVKTVTPPRKIVGARSKLVSHLYPRDSGLIEICIVDWLKSKLELVALDFFMLRPFIHQPKFYSGGKKIHVIIIQPKHSCLLDYSLRI
jgi:hypothetical protein